MKNKIEDLRNHLFEVIEKLQDNDDNGMTIEKAKQITETAQVIVNSAKIEVEFIKAIDGIGMGTGFIPTGQTADIKQLGEKR
jgi:hypothetical protein